MSGKSYKSAIVVIPPPEVASQIQPIRKQYDKAYERWMPHINLIWPFFEDRGTKFNQEAIKLTKQLSSLKPFRVGFTKASFGTFGHTSTTTVWIKPVVPSGGGTGNIAIHTKSKEQDQKQSKKVSVKTPKKPVKASPVAQPQKPVVQTSQSTTFNVLGVPRPVPAHLEITTCPSLDNLSSAIWTPENTPKYHPDDALMNMPGLDCLRFAVYTTESTGFELSDYRTNTYDFVDNDDWGEPILADVDGTEHVDVWKTPRKQEDFRSSSSSSSFSTTSSEEDNSSEEDGSEEARGSDDREEAGTPTLVPGEVHPGLMTLQAQLQDIYPDFNDISTKSVFGFQPHLTLGQEHRNRTFMDEVKRKWKDVEFEVKEVYLISRKGDLDPFQVKRVIPLGANVC